DLGQVAYTENLGLSAYLWDRRHITPIGTGFIVAAINNNGTVAGCLTSLEKSLVGKVSVIWNGGDFGLLHPTGGATNSSCALGVNNLDQAVGSFYNLQGAPVSNAYLLDRGTTTLIPTLGGPDPYTLAVSINDA